MNSQLKEILRGHQMQATREDVLPRHKPGERFLKEPVPFRWLGRAMNLPGKALHVAIVIWHLAEMNYSRTISLSSSVLRKNGVSRHAYYLGLAALEKAGLVTADRHIGRNPMVTILDPDAPTDKVEEPVTRGY